VDTSKEKCLNIFSLGGYWPYKNYHLIIEAMQLLRFSHPDLLINYTQIGSNNEKLIALAEQFDLLDRCHFLGIVTGDPFLLLKPKSFLVVPSREEGFCLAAVEALCRGIPSLLSNRKCLYDFKNYSDNLFWLEELCSSALASQLLLLSTLTDEQYLHLSSSLQKEFSTQFSIETIAPNLIEFYDS